MKFIGITFIELSFVIVKKIYLSNIFSMALAILFKFSLTTMNLQIKHICQYS